MLLLIACVAYLSLMKHSSLDLSEKKYIAVYHSADSAVLYHVSQKIFGACADAKCSNDCLHKILEPG